MTSESALYPSNGNRDGGAKKMPCTVYGCRRVYPDVSALELHVREHEISAQSLAGKVMLCSTTGCSGSFPNMQKLMEHMRHHHKPNIFFMCESCRTKLRSYRGLLTHLHTCSKVPRAKKPVDTASHQPAAATVAPANTAVANANMAGVSVDQNNLRQDLVSTPQQLPSQTPNQVVSFPTAAPQQEPAVVPVHNAPFPTPPEGFPSQQLIEPHRQPPAVNLEGLSPSLKPSNSPVQNLTQSRSTEPIHSAPVSAPQSPAAVWKKNQGMASYSRILWEHTKGRYTCVQCGQTASNRKEMTQHISTHHSGYKAAENCGSSATDA